MEGVRFERAPEKEEELVDTTPTPGAEETRKTWPYKKGKRAKAGDMFIEWPPFFEAQSTVSLSRPKRSKRRKMTQVAPTGTTFIEWFSTAMAGSSDLSSGQRGGVCLDGRS